MILIQEFYFLLLPSVVPRRHDVHDVGRVPARALPAQRHPQPTGEGVAARLLVRYGNHGRTGRDAMSTQRRPIRMHLPQEEEVEKQMFLTSPYNSYINLHSFAFPNFK
jgi:hypothetical protein